MKNWVPDEFKPNRNDPPLQCSDWGYKLFHMSFDWQNEEGKGQELEDAARRILHGFATEQTVGYADAQKYGSGFASTGAGVEIKD